MSSLSTLPKGDSAWLLRKAIERIMEQVSVLETNIGSSTTGNSANTQIIFNDNGTLRGDAGLVYNKTTDALTVAGLVTAGSATITGDLTVATDRLKVVTGSTAVQIGATTQTQFGTTAWPTSYVAKSGSKVLIGNSGELLLWNEAAAVSGNLSTLFVGAKSGPSATMIAGGAIKAGIENITDYSGFLTLSTQKTDATMVERYRIDSTGIATWSNVGGVAGTAMTLNSTGLGIGVSPSVLLHVQKSQNADTTLIVNNTNSGAAASARLDLVCNANNSLTIQSYGQNYSGNVCGIAAAKLNAVIDNSLTANSTGLLIGTSTTNPLYFATANAVKMTLDASGNLLIDTTSASGRVAVDADLAVYNGMAVKNTGTTYGASSFFFRFINSSGVTAGSIQHTAVTTTNYSTTSDSRLKESKGISTDTSVIDNTIVRDFVWKADGSTDRGVFAQEAQSVKPRAISAGSDDLTEDGNIKTPWSVDYSKYVPDLIVYCQQLKKQVVELTARVQTLEAR